MLIFDQLKKSDPHLRLLAIVIFTGMTVLLGGLWWVQVVSARDYQANLETQSSRTVRIPAVRGKILDRTGTVALADNQPQYEVSLYLEELSDQFRAEFSRLRPKRVVTNTPPFWLRWLGGDTTVVTQKVRLKPAELDALAVQARYNVVSNVVRTVGHQLQTPVSVDFDQFRKHYETRLALPYPVVNRLEPAQIARFEEQTNAAPGLDLGIQSTRVYPHQTTAAHLLGYLHRDDRSVEGEESYFSYRLPDYSGVVGIEYAFDPDLHGRAGEKSVLVNFRGYRQTETVWAPAEPGENVVLTIDFHIQQAAERALQRGPGGTDTRGAVVVMDVHSGDVLAIASSPTFNPNGYVQGFTDAENQRLNDMKTRPLINRATQQNYAPGSIFKTLIALACLDNGMDPKAIYNVQPNPADPSRGIVYVPGGRKIKDTAPPGPYDFVHGLIHSSNAYFVENGLRYAGINKIVQLGKRLHLGERCNLGTRQEAPGYFPDEKKIRSGWSPSATASICIGQEIDVTPLQMTVLACAIANGGRVLWPRLVDRIEPQDPLSTDPPIVFPKGRVRDNLGVKPQSLRILRDAMLQDVESAEGTGRLAAVPNLRICAKTGTAQIQNARGELVDHTTWFLSFAPYENPRYAVVVMVESGGSGGGTCGPITRDIYAAIQQSEQNRATQHNVLAQKH